MKKVVFLDSAGLFLPTSWHYSGFGTKLSPLFGFAKSSKYKTNFILSLIPKLLVACVRYSCVSCVALGYEDIKVL